MDTSHNATRPAIALIGAGRVGSALGLALQGVGYPIAAVASRTPAHAAELAAQVGAPHLPLIHAVRAAPFIVIAVPDDALTPLAQLIADARGWRKGQMVVHVSGALPAAALAPAAALDAHVGSFHPLAAFAARNLPLPHGLTFAIEADGALRTFLDQLAADLGGRPLHLAAADKPLYHAAAVLASNYTVVLAALAAQLLERTGATPDAALDALLPLLTTTLQNLHEQRLPAALTGPLVRGDVGTVAKHLAALSATDEQIADVYRTLGLAALPLVAGRQDGDTMAELALTLHGVTSDK